MSKVVVDVLMAEKGYNAVKELSCTKGLPMSDIVSMMLKEWYETNKERLGDFSECGGSIRKLSVGMDEETLNVYQMFLEDSLGFLLQSNASRL